MPDSRTIIPLRAAERVWAVACIHGEAERLAALHDRMAEELDVGDRIVYLGNYFGYGPDGREVLDELIRFRRWFLSFPPYMDPLDVVYLRGAQEEMWGKLMQLQFAPDPAAILDFMAERGMGEALAAFGADLGEARRVAREGTLALTYWCNRLRDRLRAIPGWDALMRDLSRAAATPPSQDPDGDPAAAAAADATLFVHAGLDVEKPVDRQADAFWWAARSFEAIERPYGVFSRIVRGFDPDQRGVVDAAVTLSIDAGAGRGGPLTAVRLTPEGVLEKRFTV
ncbi:MAG: hypothetical protein RIB45_16110 [Marivibrio sp.]|uniref:hypothetical protein n=1 Tax=Marivibrio sp. TaxID=2039719 RepID=UPI0032EB6104